MKSDEKNNKQGLQSKTENPQMNESVDPLKDGIRYDYNDSSDFKDDKMS